MNLPPLLLGQVKLKEIWSKLLADNGKEKIFLSLSMMV
jgi:hypothetical protein